MSPYIQKLDCAPSYLAPYLPYPTRISWSNLNPVSKSHLPCWGILGVSRKRPEAESAGYLFLLYPGYHVERFVCLFLHQTAPVKRPAEQMSLIEPALAPGIFLEALAIQSVRHCPSAFFGALGLPDILFPFLLSFSCLATFYCLLCSSPVPSPWQILDHFIHNSNPCYACDA